MKRFAVVALVLLALACSKEPPSTRWNDAAAALAESAKPIVTASAPPQAGGALNKFFPADGEGGYTRVFTQEKDGFAEAKLKKDGKDVATASISDTRTNDEAKKKFEGVTEKVGAYPVIKVGNNQSSVLVADRYQVKISSPTLDHEARKALLAKFDLAGLSKL
jgi:hypothetical protein